MNRFVQTFFPEGVGDILISFLCVRDALNLIQVLHFHTELAQRLRVAMFKWCTAETGDCHYSCLRLFKKIKLDWNTLMQLSNAYVEHHFEKVSVSVFSSRSTDRSLDHIFEFWSVKSLKINTDFFVPMSWPYHLRKLKLVICPKDVYVVIVPIGIVKLVIFAYTIPYRRMVRLLSIPNTVRYLSADDYTLCGSRLEESNVETLKLRLYNFPLVGFPVTVRILELIIGRFYAFTAQLLHLIPETAIENLSIVFPVFEKKKTFTLTLPCSVRYLSIRATNVSLTIECCLKQYPLFEKTILPGVRWKFTAE
jgi:hypothetical protein